MSEGQSPLYTTTDFYTICVLLAKGFKYRHMSSEGPGEKIKRFHFDNTDELEDILQSHSNGELSCKTLEFINAIENVKRMLRY